jgi:hypothetical protein
VPCPVAAKPEPRLSGRQPRQSTVADAYTRAGPLAPIAVAAGVAATRRKRAGASEPAGSLNAPESVGRPLSDNAAPAPAQV